MSACAYCDKHEGDPLCDQCRSGVTWALGAAPGLYVRAVAQLGPRGQAMSERVSTSRPDSRSPVRDNLLVLCDSLCRRLLEWEGLAFGQQPANVRAGFAVQRASGALGHDLPAALTCPRGLNLALSIVQHARRLQHALGESPLVHQLAAPCPTCNTRALIRKDGSEKVECRMCGNAWPEERYELLVRALTSEASGRDRKGP